MQSVKVFKLYANVNKYQFVKMTSAKMIGIEMTSTLPFNQSNGTQTKCTEREEEHSNALKYVVFQLDDDIAFKLNENCTIFYLMKLLKNHFQLSYHSFTLIALTASVLFHLFIHLFVCSFVSTLHLHFELKVVRYTNW